MQSTAEHDYACENSSYPVAKMLNACRTGLFNPPAPVKEDGE